MPVIQATQKAEIRRITVGSQPRQIGPDTIPQKLPNEGWWNGSSGRAPV
jgi:hypothetical protein